VTVHFGCFLENYRKLHKNCRNDCATFFNGKSYVLILLNSGLGYILGEFFTNASGHPGGSAAPVSQLFCVVVPAADAHRHSEINGTGLDSTKGPSL
jgi:hypothetical protein